MPRKSCSWLFLCPNTNITSDIRAVSSGRFENLQYSTGYLGTDWSSPYFVLTNIGKYIKCLSIMLQNTNIPQEANVLLLPVHFYLTDVLGELTSVLEAKALLNEVFMSYLLRVDHGCEFSTDNKDKIYNLNQGLQDMLDMIALQNPGEQ